MSTPQATDLVAELLSNAPACAGLVEGDLLRRAADEIAKLRAGLDSFVKIADEAATQWDNDNDARVGKMLLAMAGRVPRYRADIDAIHALRRSADDVPAKRDELGGWRCDHCQEWNRWGPNDGNCTRCSVTRTTDRE